MVNVDGEVLADVLITDGVIEAVSPSLTVRNVCALSIAPASSVVSATSACHRGLELCNVYISSWLCLASLHLLACVRPSSDDVLIGPVRSDSSTCRGQVCGPWWNRSSHAPVFPFHGPSVP